MDNDELRKVLHAYTGDFVPVLRAELARLIVDSDELAALKARIAGAVQSVRDAELFEDGIEADAHGLGIHTIADAYMAGRQHALDELVALLRLPVGEVEA